MAAELVNISASTLDGGINDSVTALDVVDGSTFPSAGDFWIRIDDEIIKVGARSTNTLSSLTRGQAGGGASAAASHSSGAAVTGVLTSQAITQLRADITRQGTHAQMAALTDMKSGDVFWFDGTDTPYHKAIYNGSSWDLYFDGIKCTPPVLGDFTWDNQSTSAAVSYGGAVKATIPVAGGNLRVLYKAAPSTPYTIRAIAIAEGYANNDHGFGPLFRENSSGRIAANENRIIATGIAKWNSASSFSGNYSAVTLPTHHVLAAEIEDNGTNRISRQSVRGVEFREWHSISRTDFLTGGADQVGVSFWNNTGAAGTNTFFWLSWAES